MESVVGIAVGNESRCLHLQATLAVGIEIEVVGAEDTIPILCEDQTIDLLGQLTGVQDKFEVV